MMMMMIVVVLMEISSLYSVEYPYLPVDPDLKKTEGGEIQQSGMERTLRSTNAIIALRCMMKSNRLEDYWESRVV
jgi:hypothetical protein